MKERLNQIKETVEEHLKAVKTPEGLEELRIKYLGKKGELTSVLKGTVSSLPRSVRL